MKNSLRKIVAIVLALAMCFSLGITAAFGSSDTEYNYEITVINPYCDIYTNNSSANILLYVETDNPDPDSISIKITNADGSALSGVSSYGVGALADLGAYCTEEIDGITFSYQYSWVDGGYLFEYGVDDAGDYIITVYEDGVDTGAHTEVTVQDYDTAYEEWIQEIITESGVDDDSLTDAKKVSMLCSYLSENYTYPTNDGTYLIYLWSEFGTLWQKKQLTSYSAPSLVINIATNYLGIDGVVNAYAYSGNYSVHAYVVFEDNYYLPCPSVDSGTIDTDSIEVISVSSISANNGHHTYDAGTVTKEATCAEEGEITYICTRCGETYTESIDKTDHSYDAGTVTLEATCTEEGTIVYACSVCGETYTESIGKTDHSYDDGTVTIEAACTEDGEIIYTCTVCGETYTESIDATGHTLVATDRIEATCTEDGYITYTCTVCGETVTEVIETTGHDWILAKVETEATCTENGLVVYTCTVCGESYESVLEAAGHTEGEAVIENEIEATCTEDGSYDSVIYCTVCGEEISRETITLAASGHSYDEGTVTEEATEDSDGIITYTCSVCGDTYTETVEYSDAGTDDSSLDADSEGSLDSADDADDINEVSDEETDDDDADDAGETDTADDEAADTGDSGTVLFWSVLAIIALIGMAVSSRRCFGR